MGICLPVGDDDALASRAVGAEADQLRLDLRDSSRVMHPSGLKRPNEMGLFDVLGNASEWCTGTLDMCRPQPAAAQGRYA